VLTKTKRQIKVADEVWIATALLHREQPSREDFRVEEIVGRAAREGVAAGPLRPGVYVHVVQHCVANRPPNPGRYRMLLETRSGHRRLFRKGDPFHPDRDGSKITPNPEELPPSYQGLLDWYRDWSPGGARRAPEEDPLLSLAGSGKDLWADEPADEYVRRLREGWQ
jgi:hypothetical protein